MNRKNIFHGIIENAADRITTSLERRLSLDRLSTDDYEKMLRTFIDKVLLRTRDELLLMFTKYDTNHDQYLDMPEYTLMITDFLSELSKQLPKLAKYMLAYFVRSTTEVGMSTKKDARKFTNFTLRMSKRLEKEMGAMLKEMSKKCQSVAEATFKKLDVMNENRLFKTEFVSSFNREFRNIFYLSFPLDAIYARMNAKHAEH